MSEVTNERLKVKDVSKPKLMVVVVFHTECTGMTSHLYPEACVTILVI